MGRRIAFPFVFLSLLAGTAPLCAEPAAPTATSVAETGRPAHVPAAGFAARSQLQGAKLSPDGKRFAFSKTEDGTSYIAFFDADTLAPLRTIELGSGFELSWFDWAGNDRVLYSLGGRMTYGADQRWFSRLFAYDFASGKQHYIGFPRAALIGDDVIYVDPAGAFVLLDISKDLYSWPDVWRFPLDGSGHEAAIKVQKGRDSVSDWMADESGVVRLGYGPLPSGRLFVTYRSGPEADWRRVARVEWDSDAAAGWDGIGMYAGSDLGYAMIPDDDGREALYEFDYSTGQPGKLVFANPEWGVDGVVGRLSGPPEGVSFTDDAPRVHWLDPELAKIQAALETALVGSRVRIISRAKDNSRMLVWHGGEADPGAIYVFTPGERRLELFAGLRPDLDHTQLAPVRPVSYTARDGTAIRAYLTLPRGRPAKGLPLVLLPHGGPFGVRDALHYDDEVQLIANRGYAVLQPNYRGSGGYGKDFETLGEGQIGLSMQDDLDDAMDWAVAQGIADPARVCIVGGSYGGYAALWAVLRNPERYRCAASWAGVTEWEGQLRYDRDYLGRLGYRAFKRRIKGEDGHELDEVSPARQIARLDRPVLLAHGKKDKRVPFSQYETMLEAARKAGKELETLVVDDGHGFTKAETEEAWYQALAAFLMKHNPPD